MIETVRRLAAEWRDRIPHRDLERYLQLCARAVWCRRAASRGPARSANPGYAEADASEDLSGRDTARKLRILARHAFGREVDAMVRLRHRR
jgi:hypothetical protein